jgi:hypothetical protein
VTVPESTPEPDVLTRARQKLLRKEIVGVVLSMKALTDTTAAVGTTDDINAVHRFACALHRALFRYATDVQDSILTYAVIEAGKKLYGVGDS